jgi:cell division protein FtsL
MKGLFLSIFLLAALCGAAYVCYRVHQHREWNAAYGDAILAYREAYDLRDTESPLYVQRLSVFQTTMSALDRLPPLSDRAVLAREKLRACSEEMDLYRRWRRLNAASVSLGTAADFQAQANTEKQAGSCIRPEAIEQDLRR